MADPCNIGTSLYRLNPGKTAFPAHFHAANDEAIYMLIGRVSLRHGKEKITLKAGDYLTLPAATGVEHQISNPFEETAEFLCFSTLEKTDVVFYPDSDKVAVLAGSAPRETRGEINREAWNKKAIMPFKTVDYWEGEET